MIRVLREHYGCPVSVERRLTLAAGKNWFGLPNYRVIWGWNRLAWIGGKFEDRSATGELLRKVIELRLEPKYPQVNRWHIERWMPPESYGSPRQWYTQTIERADGISIPALGPYPHRGEYEHCFTLQGPRGEFIPLSPNACEFIVRAVEFARTQPPQQHRAALLRREELREREWQAHADAVFSEASPAFHGAPFVVSP